MDRAVSRLWARLPGAGALYDSTGPSCCWGRWPHSLRGGMRQCSYRLTHTQRRSSSHGQAPHTWQISQSHALHTTGAAISGVSSCGFMGLILACGALFAVLLADPVVYGLDEDV
jgi:hypothetical protein